MRGLAEKPQAAFAMDSSPAADLLGGLRVLKHTVTGPLEAHDLLAAGLPGAALTYFETRLQVMDASAFEKAVGISVRTVQRRKADPSQVLSVEQSGRTWKFAEILAQATAVMGEQSAAERWLEQPAMALNGHRPIDLLSTPAGVDMVETLLGQMEYGVYV